MIRGLAFIIEFFFENLRIWTLEYFSRKTWNNLWCWPAYSNQSISQCAVRLKRYGPVGIPPIKNWFLIFNWCQFLKSTVHPALWFKLKRTWDTHQTGVQRTSSVGTYSIRFPSPKALEGSCENTATTCVPCGHSSARNEERRKEEWSGNLSSLSTDL